MSGFKTGFSCLVLVFCGFLRAPAFTTNEADAIFNAFNDAYLIGGHYEGWWTGAEEIEMAEDAYDNSPTAARRTIVSNACHAFLSHHGSSWTVSGPDYNEYNDDIAWAVIAMARGYLMTGDATFLNVARLNWDAMYERAWDTNFFGGGLWWRTDNQFKNAAVHGPAAIGACYLYRILGDESYLEKAKAIYAWERKWLFNANSSVGAISDGIDINTGYNHWASTYNQGTFIGAAHFLHQATGLPVYYLDAILAATYTRDHLSDGAGILIEYPSNSDLSGFTGIFARWMARFARDQDLWSDYGPWLTVNADAAWSVRNSSDLAWQKWKTQTPEVPDSEVGAWGCSAAVVIMQVADPSPADALSITPTAGFTAVAQHSLAPDPRSTLLTLNNTGPSPVTWSLSSAVSWLSVSANSGTLAPSGITNVTVSLVPSATTALPPGRYTAGVHLTNSASGVVSRRLFTLVVSHGSAPIAVTGHNAGVLAPNHATAGAPNATAFDIPNDYAFYRAGLPGSTHGLPPDGVFTSLWDGTNVFRLGPYGSANALVLGYVYPGSGTLTLVSPRVYDSISLLACSANGGGTGTFRLNFADGTQSPFFSFNAQDWFGTTANVAIQGFGRLKLGAGFHAEDNGTNNPRLYQTTVDLAALGLNESPIASITVVKPAGAGAQQTTGVFAVSGSAPYREPVITQQPAPAHRYQFAGTSGSWSVEVNAARPVHHAWRWNGTPLPWATNSVLQLDNLQPADSGDYTVVISNTFGAVTSSIVSLTVAPLPASPFGQAVLADAALGYWPLSETNGTVAYDYLGGDHGTFTSTVLLGEPGHPLLGTDPAAGFGQLASAGSHVDGIDVDFATPGNAAFSVEAWVNGGAQTTDAGLVTKGYGSGGEQFNLDCGGPNRAFRFFVRDAAGNARLASSTVVPDNQWHHLVGICDQANNRVRLYVDGINVAESPVAPDSGLLISASPVSIGSRQGANGSAYDFQFVGRIQEVAIYDHVLSPARVLAHYQAASNRAPVFVENPIAIADANAGQPYSASLAAQAGDPNGDPVTFLKISGPGWLSVAGNGAVSGTPLSANVGLNGFVVRAGDPGGLFSTATLNITVQPAPAIVAGATLQGDDLLLNWTGGIAPYQVQVTTNPAAPVWQDLGTPVGGRSLLVSPANGAGFYRVYGQ